MLINNVAIVDITILFTITIAITIIIVATITSLIFTYIFFKFKCFQEYLAPITADINSAIIVVKAAAFSFQIGIKTIFKIVLITALKIVATSTIFSCFIGIKIH